MPLTPNPFNLPTTPPPAEILVVATKFRNAIDQYDNDVIDYLMSQWLGIHASITQQDDELKALFRKFGEEGIIPTEQMMRKLFVYRNYLEQLETQYNAYAKRVAPVIEQAQRDGFQLGLQAASDSIIARLQPLGVDAPFWNRINVDAVNAMVGYTADGTPLTKLLAQSYPTMQAQLTTALVNAIGEGMGTQGLANILTETTGMAATRAITIARTEMLRAYREASKQQYEASEVVEGFYRLVKKGTACLACLLLDGEYIKEGETLSDHPRGKCTMIPAIPGMPRPQWETGKEWLLNQTPENQERIMGATRYKMWKQGYVELDDFVGHTHSPIWGSAPQVKPLKYLDKYDEFKEEEKKKKQLNQALAQQVEQSQLPTTLGDFIEDKPTTPTTPPVTPTPKFTPSTPQQTEVEQLTNPVNKTTEEVYADLTPAQRDLAVRQGLEIGRSSTDFTQAELDEQSQYMRDLRISHPEQAQAISRYTGSSYTSMNGILRNGEGSYHQDQLDRYKPYIENAEKALENAPKGNHNILVYRGTNTSNPQRKENMTTVGRFWSDAGFTSASIKETAAFEDMGISMKIIVPESLQKGGIINEISGFKDKEYEYLFAPGAQFLTLESDLPAYGQDIEITVLYLGAKER